MNYPSFLQQTLSGQTGIALPYCLQNGTHVQVLDEGVIRFDPRDASPKLPSVVISCGIHGNETAPVELVDQLINRIMQGEIRVRSRVMFILGNVPALRLGQRFVEEDMNRLFCREPQDSDGIEKRRATMLSLLVQRFFAEGGETRFHYDLHTAIHGSLIEKFAIYPLPAPGKQFSIAEMARLACAGVSAILLQSTTSTTFSFFSSRKCNAAGFTVELGSARPFGQNQSVDLSAMDAYLTRLIEGTIPSGDSLPKALQVFQVSREIIKQGQGFRLLIDGETDNFTPLEKGMLLAEEDGQRVEIYEDDARIIFPNPDVMPGQRAGLIIVPASIQN